MQLDSSPKPRVIHRQQAGNILARDPQEMFEPMAEQRFDDAYNDPMFDLIDTNGDGFIDREELMAASSQPRPEYVLHTAHNFLKCRSTGGTKTGVQQLPQLLAQLLYSNNGAAINRRLMTWIQIKMV